MIVLDTHIWIWLLNEDKRIYSILERILDAAASNSLVISSISLWEASMLAAYERIKLNPSPEWWLQKAFEQSQINVIDINPNIALTCYNLGRECPSDPADRLILATAVNQKAELATCDQRLINYGQSIDLKILSP